MDSHNIEFLDHFNNIPMDARILIQDYELRYYVFYHKRVEIIFLVQNVSDTLYSNTK